jgi:2-hydroxy-6-oxonona-2,4-dienedioate hydrolase
MTDRQECAGRVCVRSAWYRVGGLRLHARVATDRAPAGAPAIVLVHGFGVSSRYLVPVARELAAGYRVYAPDLPGFGHSAKPRRARDLPELADALAAWMEAAGIERATLLGNSFGCQVVAELALRHPGRIERAVLIGPTVDPAGRTVRQQLWRLFLDVFREPWPLIPLQACDYARHGPRRGLATLRAMLGDRIEAKLPRVRVPTLVIRGGRDPIVPQRWAEEAARLLPAGRLVVIPGAGHAVNYSAPRALARAVEAFLAG